MNITTDWRDKTESVKDRLKYILADENTQQDVVIIVGSGSPETVVKAHSLILIMSSQVFEKLLDTAKVNNKGFKEIKMPDVSPESLTFVLKYIYTDYVNMLDENALDILNVSLTLKLGHLTMLCIAKLRGEISAHNVLHIWEEAMKMNVQELVQTSQDFILKNARDVFEREEFLNLAKENLCKLLASDELALDEVSLFKWILSWGEAECARFKLKKNTKNLRCVLEKILPLIRFPMMTNHQFATVVVQTNILDDKEVIDVYNYLSVINADANGQNEPPQWIFSTSPRSVTVSEQWMVSIKNENEHNSSALLEKHDEPENTKRERLLQYLQEIKDKKTICGLFCMNQADRGIKTLENITGVQPGVLNLTIPSCSDGVVKWQSFVGEIISYWNNGFLIRVVWMADEHPLHKLEVFRDSDTFKWTDFIEDNGGLNKEWKIQLDAIAPYFKQLQNAGVVVICDLLPNINSTRYLWRGRPGQNGSLKLYQTTRNYLAKHHGLHSILWTWSVSVHGGTTKWDEFYPGDDYVDIASVYMWNTEQLEINLYHKLLDVVGNKLTSMECFYSVPTPELLANQPGWSWFSVDDCSLQDASYNNDESVKTTFNGLSVINKGNNDFFKTSQSTLNERNTQLTA